MSKHVPQNFGDRSECRSPYGGAQEGQQDGAVRDRELQEAAEGRRGPLLKEVYASMAIFHERCQIRGLLGWQR